MQGGPTPQSSSWNTTSAPRFSQGGPSFLPRLEPLGVRVALARDRPRAQIFPKCDVYLGGMSANFRQHVDKHG